MTDVLPPLKEVIARYGLSAKKSLGQNFILDTNLLDKIARGAKQRDSLPFESGTVIEVGPGPGGVTRAILENGAKHLTVIEKDERRRFKSFRRNIRKSPPRDYRQSALQCRNVIADGMAEENQRLFLSDPDVSKRSCRTAYGRTENAGLRTTVHSDAMAV